ncbi:homocysteine S-methyltransferase family protein [Neobittarella massiliensis]
MATFDFTHTFTLLDGAMGTMLQAAGLPAGGRPESYNITHPQIIEDIHRAYIGAGSQVIYTNTFGANAHKLAGSGYTVEQVVDAAVRIARRAAAGTGCKVALDLGPIGELLEPGGSLQMEEAIELFARQVRQGAASGADLVVCETMTDLAEVKAAVLAVKENCDLPVWCSMSFEKTGRTFTGTSIPAMALTLSGLGAEAIGINCSLGPDDIYPLAKELAACCDRPIFIKANAGLPNLQTGSYDIDPAAYAGYLRGYIELGITVFGGCCGTSPAYIQKIGEMLAGRAPSPRPRQRRSALCSPSRVVEIDGPKIIGERINPTGKKLFKQALINGDIDYVLAQGLSQVEAGADILDVNVGLPQIDERQMMSRVVRRLQAVVDAPLQIDTTDPAALEAALRVYSGKPLINSVNGEEKSLHTVLPLAKKYGAAVVGLTLDENGIPNRAEDRLAVAEKILAAALAAGIPREDVYIDCLVLTASVQQAEVVETLKAVRMVKEQLGLKTVLGVSNISFGLPAREQINRSFLTLALAAGLDLPILNPNLEAMRQTVDSFRVLFNIDKNAAYYVQTYGSQPAAGPAAGPAAPTGAAADPQKEIPAAIHRGLADRAAEMTEALLAKKDPLQVVQQVLIPALDQVGADFEKGTIFLPQLMQSANAAGAAFDRVKAHIAASGGEQAGGDKIILATVKGDIHDIGKNIVKVILENYGFTVLDLGRDVPPEEVVRTAVEQDVQLVGLSALMTTTLCSMEETIRQLRAAKPGCRIMVGGAVLTEDYALQIGADYYAKDAKMSADIAKKIFK